MTPEEHAHVQLLEGLVKRYRRRIVELKAEAETAKGEAATWERRFRALAQRHRESMIAARL